MTNPSINRENDNHPIDILIDSRDRVNGNPSDFLYNLAGSYDVGRAELRRVSLGNTLYNFEAGINNRIPVSTGDVFVSPGNYTISDLTAVLAVLFGMAVTYDPITMRINTAAPITINWANAVAAGQEDLANIQLGFLQYPLSNFTGQTFPFAPNLSAPNLFLDITGFASPSVSSYDFGSWIVHCNVNRGEILTESFETGNRNIAVNQMIRQMRIQLRCTDARPVNPANFVDWTACIRLYLR